MPKVRRLGGTKSLRVEEYTGVPLTMTSPETGLSSPAMDRMVVVLPQPLGPSKVNSRPSGTLKLTPLTALTERPAASMYSAKRLRTSSMVFSGFLDAEALAQDLGHHCQQKQRADEHDTQCGEFDKLPCLPEFPDDDGEHLAAGAVQENG